MYVKIPVYIKIHGIPHVQRITFGWAMPAKYLSVDGITSSLYFETIMDL